MAREIIVCRKCGFEAPYVSFGKRGTFSPDVATWARTCQEVEKAKHPADCEHLDKALLGE